MKVIIGECSSKKVVIRVTFDAGALADHGGKWPLGTAHLVEHLIFQGTSFLTNEELMRKLAMLGADYNGLTWNDKVSFYVVVPMENALEAAELLRDMITDRIFDNDLFEKEKLVVLEEERDSKDDVESNVIDRLYKFLCDGPLAVPIIGSKESIKSITLEQAQSFYDFYYKPQNLLLTISGHSEIDFYSISNLFGPNSGKFRKF